MTPALKEHTCVFGLGWGDEGKGKIVDLLCPAFDVVVRFNGGANAGHTVCIGPEKYAVHLLPTGVLHDDMIGVIGPGVVADPTTLLEEIDSLVQRGLDVLPRLKISDRAHLVLPYHKIEDNLNEASISSGKRIGTTARGIGPAYADKMRRTTALRFADLAYDSDFIKRARGLMEQRAALLSTIHNQPSELDIDSAIAALEVARERLGPQVCDTTEFLHGTLDKDRPILFEGANGMLLDVDHGTYPFVTSSSTGPHGIGAGAGVPPGRVTRLIGVAKAYSTRVGSGPFVTELDDEIGEKIRTRGKEFGTTTGRPRRCGWFDGVTTRYAARLTGATDIALLHLDTLGGFDQVGICTAYKIAGETVTSPPAMASSLEQAEPVVEFMPGWSDDVRGVREFDQLPTEARAYIEQIEKCVGAPVSLIGVGPERTQIIVRDRLGHLHVTAGSSAAT